MDRAHLADLAAFVAIARHLSFRRAAVELGITASALSHTLKGLEDRLAIRLVNRTTRSVALTEAGHRLFNQLLPALAGVQTAVEDLNAFRMKPHGTLRINAPRQALRQALVPLIAEFSTDHPSIRFEVSANDHMIDVISEGFDAGVRFGELIAEDMISIPIGPRVRDAVVATPGYFETHPKPRHPRDLKQHRLVSYRYPSGKSFTWEFQKGIDRIDVEVDAALTFDDMDCVLDAALEGAGVAFVFEAQANDPVADGRLVRVLEAWCPATTGFHLYYPSRRNLSFGMRTFLDFLREKRMG
jgi:DNA-binding transcriptional LysR family regulator